MATQIQIHINKPRHNLKMQLRYSEVYRSTNQATSQVHRRIRKPQYSKGNISRVLGDITNKLRPKGRKKALETNVLERIKEQNAKARPKYRHKVFKEDAYMRRAHQTAPEMRKTKNYVRNSA